MKKIVALGSLILSVIFTSTVTSYAQFGGITNVNVTSAAIQQAVKKYQAQQTTQTTKAAAPTDTASVSVSSCVDLQHDMVFGSKDVDTNGEVSDLQFFLQSKGYLKADPTGYFGSVTGDAVNAFQKANGMTPASTGKLAQVGSLTRAKIKAKTCATTTSDTPTQNTSQTTTIQTPVTQTTNTSANTVTYSTTTVEFIGTPTLKTEFNSEVQHH